MAVLEHLRERIGRVPPFALDSALAIAILAVGVIDLALWQPVSGYPRGFHGGFLAFALMSVAAAVLAFRRIKLGIVVALSLVVWTIAIIDRSVFLGGIGGTIESAVLVFFVAEQFSTPGAVAGLITAVALNVVVSLEFFQDFQLFDPLLYFTVLYGLVWLAGRAWRRRRQLTSDLQLQTEELRREHEGLIRQALASERDAIARELRELVIRDVEEMKRETVAARVELAVDPGAAMGMIEAIETTGRRTLVDMERVVSLTRVGEGDPLGPAEGTKQEARA